VFGPDSGGATGGIGCCGLGSVESSVGRNIRVKLPVGAAAAVSGFTGGGVSGAHCRGVGMTGVVSEHSPGLAEIALNICVKLSGEAAAFVVSTDGRG
jgi:hypothetical protein